MGVARPEPPRVLFICADPVGEEMAGLGIRCWELARALAKRARVTIAHGGSSAGELDGVRTVPFSAHSPSGVRELIGAADTVVAHPQWPLVNRWMRGSRARIVVDLYCPETLETLALLAGHGAFDRRQRTATTVDRLHAALRSAHHFICASDGQRDLWLGAMLALRLLTPELYDRDPSLRGTIDLVPFGVPSTPPKRGSGAREALGLEDGSEIVLWNGGIWRWLDAGTAIRAVAGLVARRPAVKLVFMGGAAGHPAAAESTRAARELAAELGLLGTVVHFNESWIPYRERGGWLTQADCALSAHAEALETRFAYRTRLLDCFWAGLPVVCTAGDELAATIEAEDLGAATPPGDAEAMARALEAVLDRGRAAYAPRLEQAAARHHWERVAEPLARWVHEPALPPRPGDGAGVVRAPLQQRLRDGAYLAGGRALLARGRRG